MERVLITGGSGMIGSRLTEILEGKGYRVAHLSRRRSVKRENTFYWDISAGKVDEEALKGTACIVHLAGENIGSSRWTKNRKRQILESRVLGLELLEKKITETGAHIKALISASAVGIYKKNCDAPFSEEAEPENDFLGSTCQQWEGAADRFAKLGVRVVKIRTGVVLSNKGGALPKMAAPVRFFIGAPVGKGTQSIPWIHIDDICGIYVKAIEEGLLSGVFNAVSPHPVTNGELTSVLGRVLKRPLFAPNVPGFVIKFLFGELSCLVLDSQRVSSEKIVKAGYQFKYPYIDGALDNIFVPVKKVW
ncbi:MAG: TIGR01777 family oxidoreductase [Nitrospinota bacterium]